MAIATSTVSFGADFTGYFAHPEHAKSLPAVVVFQEAFGVDAHIEDVTRRFAAAGYAALAPDLYARNGVRPPLLAADRLARLLTFINTMPPGSVMDPDKRKAALEAQPEPMRSELDVSMKAMFGAIASLDGFEPLMLAATRWLRS